MKDIKTFSKEEIAELISSKDNIEIQKMCAALNENKDAKKMLVMLERKLASIKEEDLGN